VKHGRRRPANENVIFLKRMREFGQQLYQTLVAANKSSACAERQDS
jgi:hypothetical protein